MGYCQQCGDELPLSAPGYYRLCTTCFKQQKNDEKVKLTEDVEHFKSRARHWKGLAEQYQMKALRLEALQEANRDNLTLERVMQLIKLVHPDQHKNSATANEVTRWLLGVRERLARSKERV